MGCVERLRNLVYACRMTQGTDCRHTETELFNLKADLDALAELVAQVEAYCDRTFDPNGGPESDEDWAMVNALIAVLGEGRKGVPG